MSLQATSDPMKIFCQRSVVNRWYVRKRPIIQPLETPNFLKVHSPPGQKEFTNKVLIIMMIMAMAFVTTENKRTEILPMNPIRNRMKKPMTAPTVATDAKMNTEDEVSCEAVYNNVEINAKWWTCKCNEKHTRFWPAHCRKSKDKKFINHDEKNLGIDRINIVVSWPYDWNEFRGKASRCLTRRCLQWRV